MIQDVRKLYSVSLYGRFGYLIHMIVLTIFWPILVGTSLKILSTGKYFYSVAFMLLGILGFAFSIYSMIQLLKRSPRFILDDKGILCPGIFCPRKILWHQVTCYKINRHAGAMVLIDLYLDNRIFFKKYKRLDASGLAPNYEELCKDIDTYLVQCFSFEKFPEIDIKN